MVSIKFAAIFCVISIVLAKDDWIKRVVFLRPYSAVRQIDSIKNEPTCISRGGMCTIAADCPAGLLVEDSGLCPLQQRMGVECCYGMSYRESRCSRRGGECMSVCNSRLQDKLATDCPEKTACCILVE